MADNKNYQKRFDYDLLKKLVDIPSPSGFEAELVGFIAMQFGRPDKQPEGIELEYFVDHMSNMRITLKGTPGAPHIAYDAHLDEIGLMVVRHDDDVLHVETIGGVDPAYITGTRFAVRTACGDDVHCVAARPSMKFIDAGEVNYVPDEKDVVMNVIGAGADKILRGDAMVYDVSMEDCGDGYIMSRALDNKIGLYIGIKVLDELRRMKAEDPDMRIPTFTLNFSAQEEIGCRGTGVNAYDAGYDCVIVHDVTHATDHPNAPAYHADVKLDEGPTISVGPNINKRMRKALMDEAEGNGIEYQVDPRSGACPNDSRDLQLVGAGIPVGLISVPIRYMHSPNEVTCVRDIVRCQDIVLLTVLALADDKELDFRDVDLANI